MTNFWERFGAAGFVIGNYSTDKWFFFSREDVTSNDRLEREGRKRGVIHSDENAVSMIVIENPIK